MATFSSILAWNSHRQRSLVGYKSKGSQELDTTYWLNHHQQISISMRAESLQSCLTLCNPMDSVRLLCPRDSPGKNTGVGFPTLCIYIISISISIYTHIHCFSSKVSFKISVFWLIFFWDDLSFDICGMLSSPTPIGLLSIYPFMFVSICFVYLVAVTLDTYIYIYNCYIFFHKWYFNNSVMFFFVLLLSLLYSLFCLI